MINIVGSKNNPSILFQNVDKCFFARAWILTLSCAIIYMQIPITFTLKESKPKSYAKKFTYSHLQNKTNMVIFNSTNKHIFLPKALESQKLKLKLESTKQRHYPKSLQFFKKNHIKIMLVVYKYPIRLCSH